MKINTNAHPPTQVSNIKLFAISTSSLEQIILEYRWLPNAGIVQGDFLKMICSAICFLWPLDTVLSSVLCETEGGPTSYFKLNISHNYLLIGFLLVLHLQSVLLLVR